MDTVEQSEIKQALQHWFNQLARAVNSADYDFAQANLFAEDVVSFGTKANELMQGLAQLSNDQWQRVWPAIRDFAFDDNLHVWVSGDTACGVITWRSTGFSPDGVAFKRPGRATVLFERRDQQWLAVHTHFSLTPEA